MLRNVHGVGIAPPAAGRDELSGGMTMMKGMMETSNMRGRKNKGRRQQDDQRSALLLFETSCTGQCLWEVVQPLPTGQEQRNIEVERPLQPSKRIVMKIC